MHLIHSLGAGTLLSDPLLLLDQAETKTRDGISIWGAVATGLGIIGGLIAIQQFASFILSRRKRAALERLAEEYADKFEAEEAENQLRTLKQGLAAIRQQIERDIPREARRVYYENRLETLAHSIGEQYAEYERAIAELGSGPPKALDQRLRSVIQQTISPMHAERERRERQLRLLVLLLVILAVIPRQFAPITLWYNYFDVMFSTKEDVSGGAFLLSALIAAVVLAILLIYIARFILWKLPLSRSASRWHPPLTVKLLATAPLLVVSSSLLVQFSAFWRPDDYLDYYDHFDSNFYGVAGVACTIGLGVALALVWVTVQGIRRAAQSHAEEPQNQPLP